MKKYAKVINEETKACEVGLGTNSAFYQSIGMTLQEVEQAYDSSWYLAGYAPEKPVEVSAKEARFKRDALLTATDKYMIVDFPITDEERENYKTYRQYLRDITQQPDFPDVAIKSFEEFTAPVVVPPDEVVVDNQ